MRILLNLIPEAVARRRARRSRRRLFLGLPILGLAVLAGVYALLTMQETQARRAAAETERLLAPVRPVAIQLAQLQSETESLDRRRQQLDSVIRQGRPSTSQVLAEISRLIPGDAWLATLQIDGPTVTLAGGALRLRSAAEFVDHLAASGVFTDVRLESLQETPTGGERVASFTIRAALRSTGP